MKKHSDKPSLLKNIQQASLETVSEADLLTHLQNIISVNRRPAQQDDTTQPTSLPDAGGHLLHIASQILTPAAGAVRAVLYLPYRQLVDLYLKPGGGREVASAAVFDDAELGALVADPTAAHSRLVQMPDNFTFQQLLTSSDAKFKSEVGVLIDIPKNLLAELKNSGTDTSAAREILSKIMSHKFYVMTLNVARARQLPASVAAASDVQTFVKRFDPNVIENYPHRTVRAAAIDEWDDAQEARARARAARRSAASAEPASLSALSTQAQELLKMYNRVSTDPAARLPDEFLDAISTLAAAVAKRLSGSPK